MIKIGIDTGGTFTDLVVLDDESGEIRTVKVPSTPDEPALAPLEALRQSGVPAGEIDRIVLGTTIATNAGLQKKGATVLYVGTLGVEDVPIIGRIDRKEAYNPAWPKPDSGVRRRHVFGIAERADHKGNVLTALEDSELVRLGDWIDTWLATDPDGDWAVAVNLLFSYVHTAHEARIGEYLAKRFSNLPISLSHRVSPIWREYERGTTCIADASIKRLIKRFVDRLSGDLQAEGVSAPLTLMKSNGGHADATSAADVPVQIFLSGLAGGVIAGRRFARDHLNGNSVTLDMGGTSADVGLIFDGEFGSTTEYEVEWGVPISALFIDYITIGAGGGSIAHVDSGGFLCVGPKSAGAEPGPACYGRGGTEPTITDANIVLGRLDPEFFLGGRMKLKPELAHAAVAALGKELGLDVEDTAVAVLDTAAENMADAIRLMTVERGLDHREFGLVAFGGAGSLHASDVAARLNMARVVVPPHPGLCSALGTLLTNQRVDRARTVLHRSDRIDFAALGGQISEIAGEAEAELRREGLVGEAEKRVLLNMRYLGQSFGELITLTGLEIDAAMFEQSIQDLHVRHEELYGYSMRDKVVEITEVRVVALGEEAAEAVFNTPAGGDSAEFGKRPVYFSSDGFIETTIYRREALSAGARIEGPALIEEMDSTTLVHPGGTVEIQLDGSMLVNVRSAADSLATAQTPERDPVTLTIVNNALRNICDEMASTMVRTAYSPIFSESRDFSCMIFDKDRRLVGQAEMNPAIICAGLHTVPHCVDELGLENFLPGDVIVHNDPYRGQCHMPEHLLMKPVFLDGELIGFAANIAHIAEIGGMAPGSFATTATEVFQEGLRLPPVKLMAEGEYVKDVWRIVMANHRTPNTTWGDFHAIMGSLTTAERRLQALVARLGVDAFSRIGDALIEHAEQWTRTEIGKLPNGTYEYEDFFEDDGVVATPYTIRSKVEIMDDEIIVDLSGSDAQALGPINVTYVATSAAGCTAVLQSISARDVPLNSGCFKPIKVIAPPGTVVNPVFPAPSVAGNTEGQPRVITAVQGALAQAIPERVGAAEGGSACNLLLGGVHPDTGEFYTHYQLDGGGWGGRRSMDGNSAQCPAHASTIRATPIEVFESRFPLRTLEYSLRPDSGGAGTWRGGLGIRRVFEVTSDEVTVSALFDRMKDGPWGLWGGADGTPGGIFVRQNGCADYRTFTEVFGCVSPTKFVNIKLKRGDLILLLSPGGGGYGAPGERAEQAVRDDFADGFISAKGVETYGQDAKNY